MANDGSRMFRIWEANIDVKTKIMNLLSEAELIRKKVTVHKVPTYLRENNPKAYTPLLVSFGPYHHGYKQLQLMDAHKEEALVHFIRKVKQPLYNIVQEIRNIVTSLREAYSCLDDKWNDNETFMKMMILDGCFMLDLIWFFDESCASGDMKLRGTYMDMPTIRRDMLLIENQLPFLLLTTLAKFQGDPRRSIKELLIRSIAIHPEQIGRADILTCECSHALDLFRRTILKEVQKQEETNTGSDLPGQVDCCCSSTETYIEMKGMGTPMAPGVTKTKPSDYHCRCAVELQEAGVRFKLRSTSSSYDVHFNPQNGILHLPQLMADDITECVLLNTIAFEQLHADNNEFISFVFLMDEIINTAKDVRLLRENDIILNMLGSDEEVAVLFNAITKNVTLNTYGTNMLKVRKDISRFCRKRRNRWRASLNHTYFGNPWSIISLVGATLVILLAIIQAICAIIQL